MKKTILFMVAILAVAFIQAQDKYAEGYFQVQVVNEEFFDTKILTDSDRNKEVIAENMKYYNRMVKAYNAKEYKDAKMYAEKAFLSSIADKIQFKTYQKKYNYANALMQNQKLILFVSMCELDLNVKDIQEVFEYCKEVLSEERFAYVVKRAEQFNETADKKIVIVKTYDYE